MLDVVFALLNFGVVIGFFYYGWNRFIVPALHSMIHKEDIALRALHDEHRRLLKEREILNESIRNQEDECKELSVKIVNWKKAVEAAQAQQALDQARTEKSYHQKLAEQAKKHHDALLFYATKPLILAQVEEDLRAHFKNPDAQRLYMERLLREFEQ